MFFSKVYLVTIGKTCFTNFKFWADLSCLVPQLVFSDIAIPKNQSLLPFHLILFYIS